MKTTLKLKRYRWKLIKYSLLGLIFCFGIGIPSALWTINMFGGEEQPAQAGIENTLRSIVKTAHPVLLLNKKR